MANVRQALPLAAFYCLIRHSKTCRHIKTCDIRAHVQTRPDTKSDFLLNLFGVKSSSKNIGLAFAFFFFLFLQLNKLKKTHPDGWKWNVNMSFNGGSSGSASPALWIAELSHNTKWNPED